MTERRTEHKQSGQSVRSPYRVFALEVIATVIVAALLGILFTGSASARPFTEQQCLIVGAAALVYAFMLGTTAKIAGSIDFYFMFILMSFPFYFGKQAIVAFNLADAPPSVMFYSLSSEAIWVASYFVLQSLVAMHMGYLLFSGGRKPRDPREVSRFTNYHNSRNCQTLRQSCLLVFAVILLPTAYYLAKNISMTQEVGYGARVVEYQASGVDNLPGIFAGIMPFVLVGLIVTRRRGERWPFALMVGYVLVYMFSGSRINAFVLISVVLYVWFACFSTKPFRAQLLQVFAVVATMAAAFSFVSFARGIGHSRAEGSGIVSAFAERGIVLEILDQAGTTFAVIGTVIAHTPVDVPFSYGRSLSAGLMYVFPNFLFGNSVVSTPSVDELYSGYMSIYGGRGSSFIAEGYFNFGWAALVLFACYGMVLAKLAQSMESAVSRGDHLKVLLFASCFMIIVFYVRSDVRTFLRKLLWNAGPIFAIEYSVRHVGRRRGFADNEEAIPMLKPGK